MMWRALALALSACLIFVSSAQADYIRLMILGHPHWIEGRARVLPGRMVSIDLPDLKRKLILKLNATGETAYVDEIIKAPSRKQLYNRKLKAARKGTLDDCFELALWVAQRGLTKQHFEEVLAVMEEKAPDDERVQKLKAFWQKVKQPLPEKPGQREHIIEVVGSGMEFITSDHYLLAHDPPGKERAQIRLELMEQVYESFYLWFYLKGRELDFPDQKLMVTLYGDYDNYMLMVNRTDPELRMAAGFWSSFHNVAVYYAQDTTEFRKELRKLLREQEKEIEEAKRQRAPGTGELIRRHNSLKLLLDIIFEGDEIEVVTHEGCHQLAGNSGLLPPQVSTPIWVHEGLAAFFETPGDAAWAGIGAVNERRIETYRALKKLKDICTLEFITSDRIFTRAATVAAKDAAYGPSWALTHFLMNKKFDKFMEYYDALSRLPADMPLPEELLLKVFKEVFGKDLSKLEQEWHFYMSGLKTLREELEEAG